jgi:uncharacterized repeat protein (TIGR02543 family)
MKTEQITIRTSTALARWSACTRRQAIAAPRTKKQILLGLVLSLAVIAPHLTWAAAPTVDNATGASNVLSISATLTGTLTSTGGAPTQVYVYWGTSDGGTTFGSWGHTNDLGTNTVGPLSLDVANLTPNQLYYYRFYATNLTADAWASATTNFQTLFSAGPAPVNLGSTAHFTILSGAQITYPGSGIINGDIGAYPISGASIHIPASVVNGTVYASDAAYPLGASVDDPVLLLAAKGDLTIAYDYARDLTPVPTGTFLNPGTPVTGGSNIGGMNLVPGLYKFDAEAHIEGSDVTLTGGPDDVWIFQVGTALIMGADSRSVILAGGAQARNVFWQVGTSATIGTYAVFKGTIMADQSITLDAYSTMEGRALASSGQVAYSGSSGSLPNQILTIVSEHGIGLPPVGVYTNIGDSVLTNSMTGVDLQGGTQYVSMGWTLAGGVDTNGQVSGSATNMVMVQTNTETLTWLWTTNYLLNASADTNGSVTGSTNGWYLAGSNVTVTAVTNGGYTFAGWTGDVTGPTNDAVQTMTMDQARTAMAHFVVAMGPTQTLTIVSEHGIGLPLAGIYTNANGSTLTNLITGVQTMIGGTTQYVNTGWTLAGGADTNGQVSGGATNMVMVQTNNAVLTWLWSTNYWLAISTSGSGSVTGSTNGWYLAGSSVTVTSAPNPGYTFAGWTGDVPPGSTNNAIQTMTMSQARTVTAHFVVSAGPTQTLTIVSEHGTGLPLAGIYTNANGSTLTNLITGVETMIGGTTQYVNTGWTLAGGADTNGQVSGSATNMIMVQTNTEVLTWLWSTNYWLAVGTNGSGSVTGSTNGWYLAGSSVTVTSAPNPGYTFAGWTGDVTGPTNNAVQTMTMNQARTAVAHFVVAAGPAQTLTIVSEHGIGLPVAGVYTNGNGVTLTNGITGVETIGGTQYVAAGWSMIGNDPITGTDTNMVMVQTNNAVLTWLWSTNYWLAISTNGSGSVTTTNGWYAAGSNVLLTATPGITGSSVGWSGDTNGCVIVGTTLAVPMNRARSITAVFAGSVPTISGKVTKSGTSTGVTNVLITLTGGGLATTDASGNYTCHVPVGWSGIATPSSGIGGTFAPTSKSYSKLTANSTGQNYIWTPTPANPEIEGRVVLQSKSSQGVAGVVLTFVGYGTTNTATTDTNGNYSNVVVYGWTGTVTPSTNGIGGAFSPTSKSYSKVVAEKSGQNFTWVPPPIISGRVTKSGTSTGVAGVVLTFYGVGTNTTDVNGYYSMTVPYNWNGTVTPSNTAGGAFSPTNKSYSKLIKNSTGQNYIWTPSPTNLKITGKIIPFLGNRLSLAGGVVLTFSGVGSTTADVNGNYTMSVPYGWSGTVTPSATLRNNFLPAYRSFSSVISSKTGQDFVWLKSVIQLVPQQVASVESVAIAAPVTLLRTAGTVRWSGTNAGLARQAFELLSIAVNDGAPKITLPVAVADPGDLSATVEIDPPLQGVVEPAGEAAVIFWNNGGTVTTGTYLPGATLVGSVLFVPVGDNVVLTWDLTLLKP